MEALSFKTIVATVRPPRIAVLVHLGDPHWQNTCVRVIEFFTQLWGGHYNIIVPTDGKTIEPQFWAMLDAFSPDYIYSYQLNGRDLRTNEPEKFKDWLGKQMQQAQVNNLALIEEVLENRPVSPRISTELASAVRDRLIPFHFRENIVTTIHHGAKPHFPLTGTLDLSDLFSSKTDPPMMIELFRRSNDRISDLWLASAFGALSSEYGEALGNAKIFLRSEEVNDSNLGAVVVEAAEWDRISRWVPFTLCGTNTSSYRSIRFSSHEEPAVAVLGDTLRDFCLYQCLSRLRGGTVWLPPSLINEPGYPSLLDSTLRHLRSTVDSQKVALWSSSLSEDELVARVQATGPTDSTVVGYKADHALNHRRFLLAQQSSPKPTAGQFLGNALVGFIETPTPTGFSHPTKHRWIADIEISGYLPPRHAHLAAQMVGVRGDTQDVRTTRQGWSYRCPHEGTYFGGQLDEVLIRPSLKILEVPDLLHRLGLGCRLRFAPSEKGAYAEDSIAKFGSLETAATFLRQERNRDLLTKFLSNERVNQGVTDEGAYTQGRRYMDLVAIEKVLGSRAEAASNIDDLLTKHVLHRGFVFLCQSCRNAD